MAGVYELDHKGKKILCLNLANLKIRDKPEVLQHIEYAREKVQKYPPKSLLVITNVTNAGFDTEMANSIKEYAENNTPYVKASAVVGVSGWQKVVLAAVKIATGRDFYLADTQDEALEWLVNQ